MSRFVRRAYDGALSRGFGYEPHPRGTLEDGTGVGGYYVDYRAKIASRVRHPDRPLQPADAAQLALGWYERLLRGDSSAEPEFLGVCGTLEASGTPFEGGLTWPYTVDVVKYPLPRMWYSGMAQAQIASVFVRGWKVSGDDRLADIALRALAPVLEPSIAGLVSETPQGPVVEECGPMWPPSHILNGWVFAIWGLLDVSLSLGDARAERLAARTSDCLAASVMLYDTGWWSRYSLYPHLLTDLAKPFYHRLHILQMEIMRDLTGESAFGDAATRWRSYDTHLAATAAVASKVPFAATKRLHLRARRWA